MQSSCNIPSTRILTHRSLSIVCPDETIWPPTVDPGQQQPNFIG
jgi:hypothetical protein